MRRVLRWSWPWILCGSIGCGGDGGSADAIDDPEGSTGSDPLTQPLCGDGVVEGEEQCEPPINSTMACDPSTCKVKEGWTCVFETPEGGPGMFRAPVCTQDPPDPLALCGDGHLDPGEDCDDLRNEDGDGCDAQCQFEPGWECTDTLPTRCAICGDGFATFGIEPCDGGGVAVPGCTVDCQVIEGWQCTNDDVCAPICGDGMVLDEDDGVPDYYVEGCDDANAVSGDGCTACKVEEGWACEGAPSDCTQFQDCGNGIVEPGEECDDGTMDNSDSFPDACRTNCQNHRCGDITIDSDEECDDGNTVDTDECSNLCQYNVEVSCNDGLDEDDDGVTDCDDSDCENDPICAAG
jgi:cysteine-rich repeat protein